MGFAWTRRGFLGAVGGAGVLAALSREAWAGPKPATRPNILLLLADDLGYGQLGYEGHKEAKTPRLDALAAGNLRLLHCYAAHSLCAPSRTAIMTGRNAYRVGGTGGLGGELSPQETILTKVLHDHGYRTGHFGKWHQWAKPGDPQFGLDEYLYTGNNAGHVNPAYAEEYDGKERKKAGKLEGDDSELIVRRCLALIDRAVAEGKPFYANLWFHTVHSPNGSAQRFKDLYPGVKNPDYLSDLSAMDFAIGLLQDELVKRGLDENTLVVFSSDNGMSRAADDSVRIRTSDKSTDAVSNKGGMGENAVRVPGLVRWPARFPKAGTIATPIAGYDWMPTFLAAAGIGEVQHRPFDGVDVLPILAGTAKERADLCFWSINSASDQGPLYLVRGDHRLWRNRDGQQVLYRLDPANLMTAVKEPALEKELGEKLLKWRDSVLADNKQALAEAEKAGRARKKGAARKNEDDG